MNRLPLTVIALAAAASLGLAACSGTTAQAPGATNAGTAPASTGEANAPSTMSAPQGKGKPAAPPKSLLLTGPQGSTTLTEVPQSQTKQAGNFLERLGADLKVEPENCRTPVFDAGQASASTSDHSVVISIYEDGDYAKKQVDHAKQCPSATISGNISGQVTKKMSPGPQLPGLNHSAIIEMTIKAEAALGEQKVNTETTTVLLVGEVRGLTVAAITSAMAGDTPKTDMAQEIFAAQVEKIEKA